VIQFHWHCNLVPHYAADCDDLKTFVLVDRIGTVGNTSGTQWVYPVRNRACSSVNWSVSEVLDLEGTEIYCSWQLLVYALQYLTKVWFWQSDRKSLSRVRPTTSRMKTGIYKLTTGLLNFFVGAYVTPRSAY
jgi:hypothetical protein